MSISPEQLIATQTDIANIGDVAIGTETLNGDGTTTNRLGAKLKTLQRLLLDIVTTPPAGWIATFATNPSLRGPNGSPGGSPELIGLFAAANGMVGVANGTQMLRTTGWRTPGKGRGLYVRDDTIDAAFVTAHPAWSFRATDVDGSVHGYHLVPNEDGAVLFDAFGAYRDGTFNQSNGAITGTDDYPAWQAMSDFLATSAMMTTNYYYRSVVPVRFGLGFYRMNSPFSLKTSCHLMGSGTSGAQDGGYGTVFICAGLRGLTLENYDTLNGVADPTVPNSGAIGCSLSNLVFFGANTDAGQDRFGVWDRCGGVHAENVTAMYFADEGIRMGAGDSTGSDTLGLGDNSTFKNIICSYNNGSGIRAFGGDSNANTIENLIANSNRVFGKWESSFLGNTWIGGQFDGNGHGKAGRPWDAAGPSAFCSYGGKQYGVISGQHAAASTTVPGTDPTVWYYFADGAPAAPYIPAWVTGMTWKTGGAALYDNANSPVAVLGVYKEGGLGLIQNPTGRALFFNGIGSQSVLDGKGVIYSIGGVATFGYGLQSVTPIDAVYGQTTVVNGSQGAALGLVSKAVNSIVAALGFNWAFHFATNTLDLRYGGGDPAYMTYLGPVSTLMMGRAAAVSRGVQIPTFFVGVGNNGRQIGTIATISDLNGQQVAAGDVFWKTNPAASASPGWVVTTAGTVGSGAMFSPMAATGAGVAS